MAKKTLSETGDTESKRRTEMQVDGVAAAPPAELERPMLRYVRIAVMILLGLSMYTMMLAITLQCVISDPCMRQEVGRLLSINAMNTFTVLLGLVYLMLLC